jgi:hypothetical protein
MSKAIAAVLSWLVLAICPLPVWAEPTISAGSATVGVGDTFTIQVSISGAEGLSTWQFDLAFDPMILKANSVSEGDLPLLSAGAINNDSGLINVISGSFMDADLNELFEGVLAVIEFKALAAGTSPLELLDVQLGFDQTTADLEDGSVTVNAQIPEPGTLALVVLATGGLALRRRQSGAGRWANHAPSASRGKEAARRPIG